MERDPQRVSSVLADPTRYSIYQYVLATHHPVSVTDIAHHFELHANVARMHLGKLVDIGLLLTHAQKTGKGGRPGNVYGPAENAVSLTVPAREFQLLADLLVQSLALMGDSAKGAVSEIGRTFGRRLGREAVEVLVATGRPTEASPFQTCADALHRLGVATHVTIAPDGMGSLVLKNCGFREVATAHPEFVCHMCQAMVEGITEVCTETTATVLQAASVPKGDKNCVYEVNGLIHLE
jgi:predicted ArsR family transcriptional regulator